MEARTGRALRRYRLAMGLAEPLAAPLVWLAHGRNRGRWTDRVGRSGPPAPQESPVWMHGASLGETLALLPLVEAMRRLGVEALVTCHTATAAELMAKRLPEGAEIRYAPLDFPGCVDRFLASWKPRLLALAEAEIWPVALAAAARSGVPVALISPRMSERTHRRWLRTGGFGREVFGSIGLVLGASGQTRAQLVGLGVEAQRFESAPALKLAGSPLPADADTLDDLRARIGGVPVWLAACTHPADEKAVLEAQSRLTQTAGPPLLILAPRHPERGDAVLAAARNAGLFAALRSKGEKPGGGGDVYIVDTLGEMGLWYRLARVAFIGGSFGAEGGHNPLEAVRLGTAVLHGPRVDSCLDIYAALSEAGGVVKVEDGGQLAREVGRMMAGDVAVGVAQVAHAVCLPPAVEIERMARRLLQHGGLRIGEKLT